MKRAEAGLYKHMRAWRNHVGLTQEQTANILGISNTVFSEKERGVRRFRPEEIEKLSEIYKEKTWFMIAFAPDDPKLNAFKRAYEILLKMSPEAAEKWMDIAEILISTKG